MTSKWKSGVCIVILLAVSSTMIWQNSPQFRAVTYSALLETGPTQSQGWSLGKLSECGKPALPVFERTLNNPSYDPEIYSMAIFALLDLKVTPQQSVPPIIDALANKDIRPSAKRALQRDLPHTLPFVLDALTHENPTVRASAASLLGNRKGNREGIVSPLLKALHDDQASVRIAAAQTLSRMGTYRIVELLHQTEEKNKERGQLSQVPQPVKTLLTSLVLAAKQPEIEVRKCALDALREFSKDHWSDFPPDTVSVVAQCTTSKDRWLRQSAFSLLETLCEKRPKSITEALVKSLGIALDDHESIALSASRSLKTLGTKALPAFPQLKTALTAQSPHLRANAARTVAHFRAEGHLSIPTLLRLLKDSAPEVRTNAVLALSILGYKAPPPTGQNILVEIIHVLKTDSAQKTRLQAIRSLSLFKSRAADAIPFLVTLMSSEDWRVQWDAAQSLGDIAPGSSPENVQTAIEALIDGLKVPIIKGRGIVALGKFDRKASSATSALVDTLDNKVNRDSKLALMTLAKVVEAIPQSKQARLLQTIFAVLESAPKFKERRSAIELLGFCSSHAENVVPILTSSLSDSNHFIRLSAAQSLSKLEDKASSAVNALTNTLHDEHPNVVFFAAHALGAIGRKAVSAAPTLIEKLNNAPARNRLKFVFTLSNLLPFTQSPTTELGVASLTAKLSDENPEVRRWSTYALSKLGRRARSALQHITPLQNDNNKEVQAMAKRAVTLINKN